MLRGLRSKLEVYLRETFCSLAFPQIHLFNRAMKINFELIRKCENPKIKRETVPVSDEMKRRLAALKEEKRIDVPEMTRKFWERLISESESA